MVKPSTKPLITENKLFNNPNQTSKLDSKLSKKETRKEYFAQRYQTKKREWHEWYLKRKEQTQLTTQQQSSKYSTASTYKVLISLKEYTQLNQQKHKLWLNFIWTLKDLNQIGIGNIIEVMRIRELAKNLISDYWETAKNEIRKGKSWNSLSDDEQQRLIRYWGYEKARIENEYLTEEEKLEKQGQRYEKEIELAKFHEERGKKGCKCYQCEEKKKIQGEIKQKWKKEMEDYDRKSGISDKEECLGCGKLKVLGEESGVCRKCLEDYGN